MFRAKFFRAFWFAAYIFFLIQNTYFKAVELGGIHKLVCRKKKNISLKKIVQCE